MPVAEREFIALQQRVDKHEDVIAELRVSVAEIHGAAKEGARFGTILMGVLGGVGIIAQVIISIVLR